MKNKFLSISLLLVAALFCYTVVSCSDDEPQPSTSTTQTESGPVEEPEPTEEPDNTINGYEYVDLGLSVKWATCNVGATSPEEYGNYYAWGEIETKEEYTEDNSVTYGKEMEDISGDSNYDAATANWGSTWRMPTREEILELRDKCYTEWTSFNGVYGRLITSQVNSNSIFIPAAGFYNGSTLRYAEEEGWCWGSTPVAGDKEQYTYIVSFTSTYGLSDSMGTRYIGANVRPVSD